MSKEIFKEELTAFFKKNAKRKLKFVDRIVSNFSGNEVEVFNHLHKKYAIGSNYNGFFLNKVEEKTTTENYLEEEVIEENSHTETEEEISEQREKKD